MYVHVHMWIKTGFVTLSNGVSPFVRAPKYPALQRGGQYSHTPLKPVMYSSTCTCTCTCTCTYSHLPMLCISLQLSLNVLDELDSCLHRLETVNSAKSMGTMAQDKFRRILSRELSHLSERSKSGHFVAEWVNNLTGSSQGWFKLTELYISYKLRRQTI